MKKSHVFSLLVIMLFAALTPAAAQDDPCFDRGAFYNQETDTCEMNTSASITIPYPVSLINYPFVDEAVSSYVREVAAAFLTNYSTSALEYFSPPWALQMDFQQAQFSEDYLSVQISLYEYTGGANGIAYYKTFLFDLANQQELTLTDLFQPDSNPLETLAPLAQAALREQLGEMADDTFIQLGTDPATPENYRSFVLTEDALILLFDEYQVAAGAAGPQSVSIPLTELQTILADAFRPQ